MSLRELNGVQPPGTFCTREPEAAQFPAQNSPEPSARRLCRWTSVSTLNGVLEFTDPKRYRADFSDGPRLSGGMMLDRQRKGTASTVIGNCQSTRPSEG